LKHSLPPADKFLKHESFSFGALVVTRVESPKYLDRLRRATGNRSLDFFKRLFFVTRAPSLMAIGSPQGIQIKLAPFAFIACPVGASHISTPHLEQRSVILPSG
jgi:hypothetical protein